MYIRVDEGRANWSLFWKPSKDNSILFWRLDHSTLKIAAKTKLGIDPGVAEMSGYVQPAWTTARLIFLLLEYLS